MLKKKKIIILGASGYIGQRIIDKLLKDENIKKNYQLILFNKNKRKLEHFMKYKNIFISDILISLENKKKLINVFHNAEVVYNLVHITNENDFVKKESNFNHLIGEVSETANVKQIIFLGGLGDKNKKLSKHLYSRINSGNILRKYKTPVTEFKVGIIIGGGNLAFEILQRTAAFLPFIIKPKNENKMTPAFVDNVINYLFKAFKYNEYFLNKILELGYGEYNYSDLIIGTKKVLGNKNLFTITLPNFIYNFLITKNIIAYILSIISGHNYKLLKNTMDLVLYDTTRREEYKIENQIPKELLEKKLNLRGMLIKAIRRIEKGKFISFWDYPTILSKLSKKSKLELKDNYVIQEFYDIYDKKFVKSLYEEIQNISCPKCWSSNIIWKFRGIINRISGGINYKITKNKILNIGDITGFWQVDNIINKENIKEIRFVALLNSPGTEYLQFIIKKLDNENYVLIIRNIYLLDNIISYIHYYMWYPFYKKIYNSIMKKLKKSTEIRYINNKLLENLNDC